MRTGRITKKQWKARALHAEAIVNRPSERVNKIRVTYHEQTIAEWPTTACVYRTWINGTPFDVTDGNLTVMIENIVDARVAEIVEGQQ
jgi:hypothetical protein